MKKNEKIRLAIATIVFIMILILFSQCVGSKKVFNKKSTLVETVTEVSIKDSLNVTVINKPIDDSFKIFVPEIISTPSDDLVLRDDTIKPILTLTPEQIAKIDLVYSKKNAKLLNKELNRILSSINTDKKSGKNSYSVKWNKVTRTIDVDVTIGETLSIETNNSEIKEAESKSELITFESVYKKVTLIPWWIWAIAVFVFLPTILRLFSPYLSLISRLQKPNS
tara:strand:- start:41 stop:709 length:669 start_codon:yes stop_codon:yes gene_type:complete